MRQTKRSGSVPSSPARREFMRTSLFFAVALPFSSALLSCTKNEGEGAGGGATVPAGQTPLDESSPLAVGLGYKANAMAVDTAKFPKKAGPDGASQKCASCAQYSSLNGGWGKCNIFAQNVVNAGGWCNTWTKKAA